MVNESRMYRWSITMYKPENGSVSISNGARSIVELYDVDICLTNT